MIIFLFCFITLLNLIVGNYYFYDKFKIYQLCGYQINKAFKSFQINKREIFCLSLFLLFNAISILFNDALISLCLNYILFLLLTIIVLAFTNQIASKNRLVFTKRFIRFFVLFNLINSFFICLSFYLYLKNTYFSYFISCFLYVQFLTYIIAHILISPFEYLVKIIYIVKAKKKLKRNKDLIVIGITGSYGKTSVKNYLYEILKENYKICKSQKSFNTEMGFTKVILNDLKDDDEILILEYGADKKHDIKKLCKIVSPNYSIITGITNQHLNTFKTFDNLLNTKYELVENTNGGYVIFNGDNEFCENFYNKCYKNKLLVGIDNKKSSIQCENINLKIGKTTFDINILGEKYTLKTSLLGKHNIINLLLAIQMAILFNIEIPKIIKAVSKIQAVEHRLKLLKNGDRYILDDSFNSNPVGAKNAIDVLMTFPNKKIVITGGLVELGKENYIENVKLGKYLTSVDVVVIVGNENKSALLEGLKESKKTVLCADNVNLAVSLIQKYFNTGDCLLFLNDLPDNYK